MKISRIVRVLLALVIVAVLALIVAEAGFRAFHVDAAHPLTLAGRKWSERYVALNAHGYRDRE